MGGQSPDITCECSTKFLTVIVLLGFQWFPLVSATNKTDHHDITEILLKVALNTIILTLTLGFRWGLMRTSRISNCLLCHLHKINHLYTHFIYEK